MSLTNVYASDWKVIFRKISMHIKWYTPDRVEIAICQCSGDGTIDIADGLKQSQFLYVWIVYWGITSHRYVERVFELGVVQQYTL